MIKQIFGPLPEPFDSESAVGFVTDFDGFVTDCDGFLTDFMTDLCPICDAF